MRHDSVISPSKTSQKQWPPTGVNPYYSDDSVCIIHADCREILPQLEPVDLVLTSPPYNLGNTTGGGFAGVRMGHYKAGDPLGTKRGGGGKWNGGKLADGYEAYDDAMPHAEYKVTANIDNMDEVRGVIMPVRVG